MTKLVTHITGKTATLGAVISTMCCTVCFPAAASIGAALGLGALAPWEGLFFHILLPVFVAVALLANLSGWFGHRPWWRNLLGMLGPVLVLVARYPLWHYPWHNIVLYTGLIVMLGVAVWDLLSPVGRRCTAKLRRFAPGEKGTVA